MMNTKTILSPLVQFQVAAIALGAFCAAGPGLVFAAETARSSSANFSLLPAGTGAAGGPATSENFVSISSTGSAIAGGVSNLTTGGFQSKDGYTGQLYDTKSLTVAADPATTMNEGDSVQLSAALAMDDDSVLNTNKVDWSVQSGPIVSPISSDGMIIAASVTSNGNAIVRGQFDGVSGDLGLSIINLPYQPNPITWDDPTPGGNGPYGVFFGTNPSLPSAGILANNFFNPGRLEMGATYYYQIFDADNNDITPGGPGPASFTSNLFRPDMRIGTKGNPATHKGNNVYSSVGVGQVGKLKLTGTRKGKLHFSIENDGDTADGHTVRANRAGRKFKFIKYFRLTGGRANITAAATRAGFAQPDLNPGGVISYQIQAKSNGKSRAAQTLNIGATSANDTRGADLAKGKVKGLVKKK